MNQKSFIPWQSFIFYNLWNTKLSFLGKYEMFFSWLSVVGTTFYNSIPLFSLLHLNLYFQLSFTLFNFFIFHLQSLIYCISLFIVSIITCLLYISYPYCQTIKFSFWFKLLNFIMFIWIKLSSTNIFPSYS